MQRAAGWKLLVRKGDPEPARVVLTDLGVGVPDRRIVTEAGDVHAPGVHARVTLGHPRRERQADAASLGETGHHPAGDPVVA